jgi:hypothetical protein
VIKSMVILPAASSTQNRPAKTGKIRVEQIHPFYYSSTVPQSCELSPLASTYALGFSDAPDDACLPNSSDATLGQDIIHTVALLEYCGGTNANGTSLTFQTTLVGDENGSLVQLPVLDTFSWGSTWNGTTGGTYLNLNTNDMADPGTGTGGFYVISINGVPVSEPSTLAVLIVGLACLGWSRRRVLHLD